MQFTASFMLRFPPTKWSTFWNVTTYATKRDQEARAELVVQVTRWSFCSITRKGKPIAPLLLRRCCCAVFAAPFLLRLYCCAVIAVPLSLCCFLLRRCVYRFDSLLNRIASTVGGGHDISHNLIHSHSSNGIVGIIANGRTAAKPHFVKNNFVFCPSAQGPLQSELKIAFIYRTKQNNSCWELEPGTLNDSSSNAAR